MLSQALEFSGSRCMTLSMADAGADIAAVGRDRDGLAEVKKAVEGKGRRCVAIAADMATADGPERAAKEALAAFGTIDILVNNAGIARSEIPAEKMEDERWLNVLDVNLNGTFWCCRSFGKRMLAAGKGARMYPFSDRRMAFGID